MYTDEDLNTAVESGIFTQSSVDSFREQVSQLQNTVAVDEENFRLISGFNDVFVVIASGLLLVSITWLGAKFSPMAGTIGLAFASWLLAEFFVLKRRMALPAIALLLTFLGGVFATPLAFHEQPTEISFVLSGILTAIAARLHWSRFRVPITVAAGTAAGLACLVAIVVSMYPDARTWLLPMLFMGGMFTFAIAMYWDASDRSRQTRKSDVAFWLHLVSAPMIVHPIFSSLGILQGVESFYSSLVVVALYIGLAMISIAVDRRAIMVSALVYVIYAFASLLENYGMISYSFAITGICIGASLLLLSAFWQSSRRAVLKIVPSPVQVHLPLLKV